MKFLIRIWHKIASFYAKHSRVILTIAALLLIFYVFIPQLSSLKESLQAVKSANKEMLLFAVVVFCVGFPILAAKYCLIAQYKLRYALTLQVQIASAFISKLLPMSIGSLTVNTFYLTKESKNVSEAASTMAINAMTSSIAFALIIIFALISSWGDFTLQNTHKDVNWFRTLLVIVLVSVMLWLISRIKKIRLMIRSVGRNIWENIKLYRQHPRKVTYGIIFNGIGSMTGITTLFICAHAVGLPVTLPQAILSYTMGNIVGSLVPTPGGLGGAEAGLYAGLVFFGYPDSTSLVAVLLYRLITYWLPLIPGYMSYHHLRKTTFSTFKLHGTKTANLEQSV